MYVCISLVESMFVGPIHVCWDQGFCETVNKIYMKLGDEAIQLRIKVTYVIASLNNNPKP